MGHEHTKVPLKLVHISALTSEKGSQNLVIHDFCKDLINENADAFITAQSFKKSCG
jgi:hypothetical protein